MKFFLIFLFSFSSVAAAQTVEFPYIVHARVDTSKAEIREVLKLWLSYLNSQPDSVYDNPYWNSEEKKKYPEFDLAQNSIYQFPSGHLLEYYRPTILSIEKEGNAYVLRTLFASEGVEGEFARSNPWCLLRIYAVKEKSAWKLKNALPFLTGDWPRTILGKITFIYPPTHEFNEQFAHRTAALCDSVMQLLHLPEWTPFEYYITDSGDEMGRILGFDFYFAGYTTGRGMSRNRILMSGTGSEWYPHEIIHMMLEPWKRHRMVEEGIATWLGGTGGAKSYVENLPALARAIAANDTVKFVDILNNNWGWQYNAFYTTGALFSHLIYDRGGTQAIREFLQTPPDDEILLRTLALLLGIPEEKLDAFWHKAIMSYRK